MMTWCAQRQQVFLFVAVAVAVFIIVTVAVVAMVIDSDWLYESKPMTSMLCLSQYDIVRLVK